ncbi:hypothetical protein M2G43_20445 [Vibrio vulnificus]|nr:hypothetical protein [Vibrio vulnificus]
MVKVLCGHFCIACLRPLTRRYKSKRRKKKVVWVSKKLILLVLNGLMLMGQKSFTLKNRMH